jgi:hypothetical protein
MISQQSSHSNESSETDNVVEIQSSVESIHPSVGRYEKGKSIINFTPF